MSGLNDPGRYTLDCEEPVNPTLLRGTTDSKQVATLVLVLGCRGRVTAPPALAVIRDPVSIQDREGRFVVHAWIIGPVQVNRQAVPGSCAHRGRQSA